MVFWPRGTEIAEAGDHQSDADGLDRNTGIAVAAECEVGGS
jgi:hypothetical protein